MNVKADTVPVVGLLINFRDAARSIKCIRSLLGESISVVVWDNSSDGGVSAHEIEQAFANTGRVKVYVSQDNLGFAGGVNRAIAVCASTYSNFWALIINNDATLRLGALARLKDSLAENSGAVLAFPDINHGGVVYGARYYLRALGLILPRPGRGRFLYPSGCCLLLACDRFSETWFDEDFFMYGEDCELGWRLRGAGDRMVHVPETLVDHEGSASSVTGSIFYETRIAAAHWILAEKLSVGRWDRVILYLGRVITLTGRAVIRSIRFRSVNPWIGLKQGLELALARKPSEKRPVA